MSERRFLDSAAVKQRYSVGDSSIARWVATRGFPPPRYLGQRRMWLLEELEAWERSAFSDAPDRNVENLTPFGAVAPIATR